MNDKEIDKLMTRYVQGTASDEEVVLLEDWILRMSSEEELPATEPDYDEVGKTILNNIYQQRSRFGHWKYYRAAAMLLLTLGMG